MSITPAPYIALVCTLGAWPAVSVAHSFSTPYVPPIPYWMYSYGCAATLIVTFALVAIYMNPPAAAVTRSTPRIVGVNARFILAWTLVALKIGALTTLLATIAGGFAGSEMSMGGVTLPLFWVVFLLGWTYTTALIGDLYPFVNPWLTLTRALEYLGVPMSNVRCRYPPSLGCWPAFVTYLGLIWVELFVADTATELSSALLVYTVVSLIGVGVFGKQIWFEQADFFAVFFRIIGKMAPLAYTHDKDNRLVAVEARLPFSGLASEPARHVSLLLFVLFMLSSTIYDGIHDTQFWTAFFWENMMGLLQPLWGDDLSRAQTLLMDMFLVYRHLGLLLFPFVYLTIFLSTMLLIKRLTNSMLSLRELGLQFTYSLVPIAFVYHFAHYYTFLAVQLNDLPASLINVFDSSSLPAPSPDGPDAAASSLDIGVVWHTQVGVVLLGHIVSAILAHQEALRVFPQRGRALVSQLPLLALMVTYTTLGLWVLAQPLG